MENTEKKEKECEKCEKCCEKKECCGGCGYGCGMHSWHGCCGGGMMMHRRPGKILLKILVVVIIFWLGFTFGRMVGFWGGYGMHDGYGYKMMRGYDYPFMMNNVGNGGVGNTAPAPSQAPAQAQ